MNIAVDPDERRTGHRHRAARARCSSASATRGARYTLEVRQSNAAAIELYERFGFRAAGPAPPLLPGQRRGRAHHVAHAGDAERLARGHPGRRPGHADRARAVILAIETSCDDTCAAVVDPRRRDPRERHLLAGHPRPLRRRRARGRLPPPPRAGQRGASTTRCARPARALDDVEPRRRHAGARASSARCSSGVATAKALAAARGLPLAPVDHLQGHVAANFLAPGAVRAAVPVPDRQRRPHAARARRGPRRLRRCSGRTLDDAAGEAFDKGARLLGLPIPAARRSSASPRDGDPAAFDFPIAAARRGPGLLLRRAEDRAALQGPRPRRGGRAERRADLAASYQRAIVEALALRVERALERTGLERLGDRRRRGGQRAAARAAGRARRAGCTSRRASCAPTTPR